MVTWWPWSRPMLPGNHEAAECWPGRVPKRPSICRCLAALAEPRDKAWWFSSRPVSVAMAQCFTSLEKGSHPKSHRISTKVAPKSADAFFLWFKKARWPEPDLESYYVTMRALGEDGARQPDGPVATGGWQSALELLEEMQQQRLSATMRTIGGWVAEVFCYCYCLFLYFIVFFILFCFVLFYFVLFFWGFLFRSNIYFRSSKHCGQKDLQHLSQRLLSRPRMVGSFQAVGSWEGSRPCMGLVLVQHRYPGATHLWDML